jgi:hypothetical protein
MNAQSPLPDSKTHSRIRSNTEVNGHVCASDVARTQLMGLHPERIRKEELQNEAIRLSSLVHSGNREDEVRTISVVVHIMHQNGEENISDDQVMQGIDDLNDAFANLGDYSSLEGADTKIQFCLAQQDPQGLPTNGITRHETVLTNMILEYEDAVLKAGTQWDPELYLNIWLVNEINSASLGSGVAGYAYLPSSHGMPEDGIVNEARWFGTNSHFSKVHIHEVGHYLGLYHTFESGCANDDCTLNGDRVCDTPPDASTSYSACGTPQNSCSTDSDDVSSNNPFRSVALGGLGDQNDLISNYMDYSDQVCQHLFTSGQSDRMNAVLDQIRTSLFSANACLTSCGVGPLDILFDDASVLAGTPIIISASYTSVVPVSFQWTFLGDVISTSSFVNYTFSNNQLGENFLYFSVINTAENCSRTDSILINVECNPAAEMIMSPQYLEVGDFASFNGLNVLANSYQWFLDGELVSTNANFTQLFDTAEEHHIFLVTGNGICTDTSELKYFAVGHCVGGQSHNWITGGTSGIRINFTSGMPEVTTVPVTDQNQLRSGEGMATISDQNGELLFYSDGTSIFNRNYEPFYTGLGASMSSTQGVMIVPDPANDHEYYVFTTENFAGYAPGAYHTGWGFAYIKVDMHLNNGMGGVSSNYTQLLSLTTEKQTSVRHCNGHDVWVICHEYHNNSFYSYLITDNGISEPIISNVGSVISDSGGVFGIGYLKTNPQGDMIVAGYNYMGITEFFGFDSNTGILSNDFALLNSQLFYGSYGVAFSPDGTKVYFSNEYDPNIQQIDLSSGDQQLMINSRTSVGTSPRQYYLGALELAPDGKIYIAQSSDTYLDVISYPNEAGMACGFIGNALALPDMAAFGLNNILPNARAGAAPQIIGLNQVCTATTDVLYRANCGNNVWSYFGGGTMVELNSTEVMIDFGTEGTDTLVCTKNDACLGWLSDTLFIQVGTASFSLGEDVTICSTGSFNIQVIGQFQSYQWNNGAQTSNIDVQAAGNYWVTAVSLGGCIARDTIHVFNFSEPFEVSTQDAMMCNDAPNYVWLPATEGDFVHHWEHPNGPTSDVLQVYLYPESSSGLPFAIPIYYTNPSGCVDVDTVNVYVRPDLPELSIDDIVLCGGEVELIQLPEFEQCSYTWQDGSHENNYTIYTPVGYQYSGFTVWRYDSLCNVFAFENFNVYAPSPEDLLLPDTVYFCDGAQYELYAGWAFDNYVWQDGSTNNALTAMDDGLYWVNTITPCGIFADSTRVMHYDMSLQQIGLPDTITACSADIPIHIDSYNPNLYSYQWSTGSGQYAYASGAVFVSAYNMCGQVFDTIYVDLTASAIDILQETIQVCDSSYIVLSQPSSQMTTWNGNIVSDSFTVDQNEVVSYVTSIGNACSVFGSVDVQFSDLYFNVSDTALCPGDTLFVVPETNALDWTWLITGFPTDVVITDTGTYYFTAWSDFCNQNFTMQVELLNSDLYELSLPDSLFACPAQLPVSIEPSGDPALNYQWSNGSSTPTIDVNASGVYVLQTSYECGVQSDSTYFLLFEDPLVSLPMDSVLCADDALLLSIPDAYSNQWNTGETANSIVIDEPGLYSVISTSENGCVASDSVQIIASDLYLVMEDEISLCRFDSVFIQPETNGTTFFWSNGNNTQAAFLDQTGTYVFSSSKANCTVVATVNVMELPFNDFLLGQDTLVSSSSFLIEGPGEYESYEWNIPGEMNAALLVSESGTYVLETTDINGCVYSDEIKIVFEVPNNESYIEVPDVFYFGNGGLVAKYKNVDVYDVKVFDDIGRLVSYGNTFPLIWDGAVNGNEASSAMYFYVINYNDINGGKKVHKGNSLMIK